MNLYEQDFRENKNVALSYPDALAHGNVSIKGFFV